MVAIFQRTRVHVDVLRLLFANLFDSLGHVLIGDFGIVVGDLDVFVIAQFNFGHHLERRL